MDISKPPAPWSIDQRATGEWLRIGARTMRLDDVRGVAAVSTAELNSNGHMLAVGLFLGAGALLVLPVAMQVLHPRFLAGGLLFIGIGLMALADTLQANRSVVHRVQIRMADGRTETFASPHAEECHGLEAALGRRMRASAA